MRRFLIGVCDANTLYNLYEGLAGSLLKAGHDSVMLVGNDTLIQQSQSSETRWILRATHDGEENRVVTLEVEEGEEGDRLIQTMKEAGIALWPVSRPIVGCAERPSARDWFELFSQFQAYKIPAETDTSISPTAEELEFLRIIRKEGREITRQIEAAGSNATKPGAFLILDLLDPLQRLVENTPAD